MSGLFSRKAIVDIGLTIVGASWLDKRSRVMFQG